MAQTFSHNLKTLIELYGMDAAMRCVDEALDLGVETIEDLDYLFKDAIRYALDA